MPKNVAGKFESPAKDLLLKDYDYLSDCFWKNEQSGETRLNLFLGIVSLALGALVSLVTKSEGLGADSIRLIVIVSLFALLVLGLITMLRMLTRNENTDRYKQGLDTIRQTIKDYFDSDHVLVDYSPIGGPEEEKRTYSKLQASYQEFKKRFGIRKFGGLAHTVAAINSFLLAGIVGAACFPVQSISVEGSRASDLKGLYLPVVLAFIMGCAIQFWYIFHNELNVKRKLREGICTHAGGVVFTLENGSVKYLLVRPSKENDREWILPKGHIRAKEGHAEAALREVREETGVVSNLLFVVDTVRFGTEKEIVTAKFYLMEKLFEDEQLMNASDKKRNREWHPYEEALKLLTFPESKYILRLADKKRAELGIL